MKLAFTKMHGLGNDFVVLDGTTENIDLNTDQLRYLADRHFGIGCDQILLVESTASEGIDFRYRIFNADGGEVSQCGNGARCFAKFVRDRGLTDQTSIRVETHSGLMTLNVCEDGQIEVDMGEPRFEPTDIPLDANAALPLYSIELDDTPLSFAAVSMGNPHAVIEVDDVQSAPVKAIGQVLGQHPIFPEGVNVGFMQIVDRTHISLRVFERGSGETLACGSGACAAVAAAQNQGLLDETVTVKLNGGSLVVSWRGPGHTVRMTGPATHVFEGSIEL